MIVQIFGMVNTRRHSLMTQGNGRSIHKRWRPQPASPQLLPYAAVWWLTTTRLFDDAAAKLLKAAVAKQFEPRNERAQLRCARRQGAELEAGGLPMQRGFIKLT